MTAATGWGIPAPPAWGRSLVPSSQQATNGHIPPWSPPCTPQPSSAEELDCFHSPGLQLEEKAQNMFFALKFPLKNNG